MKIYESISELVGHTPLMRLNNIDRRIIAKIEYFNPAGSVKDRIAVSMLDAAETEGRISAGAVIIEPTSGNTGIGLAAIGASRGYKVILTMPDTMSAERIQALRAYGAQVVLTEGAKGMAGAIEKAEMLAAETPNSFIPSQFDNPVNPQTHFRTTGAEIYDDTDGGIDILVAGVGSGGTLSGTAAYLKSRKPQVKVVAVEPEGSPVLSGGKSGKHAIQGIGAGFVPANLNTAVYDEVIAVADGDAFAAMKRLAEEEGILAGISSGAALFAALSVAGRAENNGKTIVVILPDSGSRYLSVW